MDVCLMPLVKLYWMFVGVNCPVVNLYEYGYLQIRTVLEPQLEWTLAECIRWPCKFFYLFMVLHTFIYCSVFLLRIITVKLPCILQENCCWLPLIVFEVLSHCLIQPKTATSQWPANSQNLSVLSCIRQRMVAWLFMLTWGLIWQLVTACVC